MYPHLDWIKQRISDERCIPGKQAAKRNVHFYHYLAICLALLVAIAVLASLLAIYSSRFKGVSRENLSSPSISGGKREARKSEGASKEDVSSKSSEPKK